MQFFDKMQNKVGPALTEASHKLEEGVDHVAAAANEKLHENKLKSAAGMRVKAIRVNHK